MFGNCDLSDAELLHVAAATALLPSPSSSLVHHLTSQFSTAQIGTPMDTTPAAAGVTAIRTTGLHIAHSVKLLPFDAKQPKRCMVSTN